MNLKKFISFELIDDIQINRAVEIKTEVKPKIKLIKSMFTSKKSEILLVKINKNHSGKPF